MRIGARVLSLLVAALIVGCGGGSSDQGTPRVDEDHATELTSLEPQRRRYAKAEAALGNALNDARGTIAAAKVVVAKVGRGEAAKRDLESLERADAILRDVERERAHVERTGNELLLRSNDLEIEKLRLTELADELKRREQSWQFGFIGAVVAGAVALIGLIMNLPSQLAERRLKLLLIREKERELSEPQAVMGRVRTLKPSERRNRVP